MRLWILAAVGLTVAGCGPNTAQLDKIAATQAVVDERVRAGQMTEAEGKLAVANTRAAIDAERRRNYAIAVGGDDDTAVYQPVGGGTYIKY